MIDLGAIAIERREPPTVVDHRPDYHSIPLVQAVIPGTLFILCREAWEKRRIYFAQMRVDKTPFWTPAHCLAKRFKDLRLAGRWCEFIAYQGKVHVNEIIILAIPEPEQKTYADVMRQAARRQARAAMPKTLGNIAVEWLTSYSGVTGERKSVEQQVSIYRPRQEKQEKTKT